jgi:cytoskeletal protein CcmA (bactofilin family)
MLKSSSYEGPKSDETTIISHGVKIEGKVSSSGNIRVEGEILGDITSQGKVIVGENGKVNGQVSGEDITIGGKVSGTVKAKEKLVLDSKGNLKGDIFTKILVVEAGAKFDGKSSMGDSGSSWESKESNKPSDPNKK